MKTDHSKYIHTPGGSPRNSTSQPGNNYSCPEPLPKHTPAMNVSDANNGQTSDKPANEGGDGILFHPTGHKGNPGGSMKGSY